MTKPEQIDRDERSPKYRRWLKRITRRLQRRLQLKKNIYRGYSK